MIGAEYECKFEPTKGYLALTDELWGVFCDDFGENQLRDNDTAPYFALAYPLLWLSQIHKRILKCIAFHLTVLKKNVSVDCKLIKYDLFGILCFLQYFSYFHHHFCSSFWPCDAIWHQWPLLLTWFNFNPRMDK